MTQGKTPQELEAIRNNVDKAIAEAHAVIAEAEAAMASLETINQKLRASEGNLEDLMPTKLYSEEERTGFVDALTEFVSSAKEWLSEDGAETAKKSGANSNKKSSIGHRRRGFTL